MEIVRQKYRFEPTQGGDRFQQMAPIAVDVHHSAIEAREDSLHGLTAPLLKVLDGGHVEGIHAFGNDASGNPLHHIAASSTRQQRSVLKECSLHIHVQLVGEFNGFAHLVRAVNHLEVGLGGAEKLEDKVEAVDQDEMADAEFAIARRRGTVPIPGDRSHTTANDD